MFKKWFRSDEPALKPDDPQGYPYDMDDDLPIPLSIYHPISNKFLDKFMEGEWQFQRWEPTGCYTEKKKCFEYKMFFKETFEYKGDRWKRVWECKT